jgi:hypothetical protein
MPSTVRPRSPGPEAGREAKKAKADVSPDITLPEGATRHALHETYEQSTPYKHIVVPGLLTDELVSGPEDVC